MTEPVWQEDDGDFRTHYRSSGKVSLFRFLPLLILGLIVSAFMAVVLLFLEAKWYYYIVTPLLTSLPVFGAVYLLVHLGHCRSPLVAGISSLVLLGVFYLGYWQLSYWANVVSSGPEVVQLVKEVGGAPGLTGYFNYCCKTAARTSSTVDSIFQYVFYLTELGIFLIGGYFAGHHLAGRIFYEHRKRWGSSKSLRFRADALSSALEAVETQDWAGLAQLPRIPKTIQTAHSAYAPVLEFRIEYLKHAPEEPVYVSLKGMNMGRYPEAKAMGIKGLGGLYKALVRQRIVLPESSFFLSQSFPELNLPKIPESALGFNVSPPAAPSPGSSGGKDVEYAPGLRGIFQKAGMSSVDIKGPDFRRNAVDESRKILHQSGSFVRPEDMNSSLCLPVEPEQRLEQKPFLRNFLLFAILSIIAEVVLGGVFLFLCDSFKNSKWQMPFLVLGIVFFLFLGVTLLSLHGLLKSWLSRRLTLRQGSLFLIRPGMKTLLVQLEDAAVFHIRKKYADDLCICLLDEPNRRLLLEGFNHRYIIRQQDVVSIKPLDIGLNFPMVELCYRIAGEELKLVLYQGGAIGYLPIRPIWARHLSFFLDKKLRKALGL